MPDQTNIEVVTEAVLGDPVALAFLNAMARVLHFWDDLIDRDKPVSDAEINARMWDALIEIPLNAFYRENIGTLSPILVSAIANWRIATDVERSADATHRDLAFAFIIRSTYVDLVTISAVLVAGMEHAVACGPAIRRWAHGEGFDGYLNNLRKETAARKERAHVLS